MTGLTCIQCGRPTCAECLVPTPKGLLCPDDAATVELGVAPIGSFGQTYLKYPVVTWALMAINIAMYLVTALVGDASWGDTTHSPVYTHLVMSPESFGYYHEYWRPFGATLLSVNGVQLVLNMVALGSLGPPIEKMLGWWRFLSIWSLGALGTSVTVILFGEPFGPVVTSSGAIFGLAAAGVVLARVVGFDTRTLWLAVLIIFVITFTVGHVSTLGHLGGLVFGGVAVGCIVEWSLERKPPQTRRVNRQVLGLAWAGGFLVALAIFRAFDLAKHGVPGG